MTDQQALLNQITAFETHYHYDAGFLKDMVQHAPGSYDTFSTFKPWPGTGNCFPPRSSCNAFAYMHTNSMCAGLAFDLVQSVHGMI